MKSSADSSSLGNHFYADGVSDVPGPQEQAALSLLARAHARALSSRYVPAFLRERSSWFAGTSMDYHLVGFDEDARSAIAGKSGWAELAVVQRQDRVWRTLLETSGPPRVDVANLESALAALNRPGGTIVEAGCGSGYNALIIERCDSAMNYVGFDYSIAAVRFARASFPSLNVVAADATRIPLPDRSCDIALDGAALIHTPSWESAIREECRVARSAVIVHGVTITDSSPTAYFTKRAYGFTVPEVALARVELSALIAECGFSVVDVLAGIDYDLRDPIGIPTVSESWMCRRV